MTCNDCIHSEVCYLKKDGISENYADKCGYRLFENEIRPQGEWIFMNGVTCGGYYKCNKCGEVERAEKNYCPNCGAEMRKGGAE